MKKTIAIIGAGPAALMLAAKLDATKFEVTIYEKNKNPGRKFLVAGKGGFNLTYSEEMTDFKKRYTPASFLGKALTSFDNTAVQNWFKEIGIPSFVGSSKRIYPEKGIKPIKVLNAILKQIKNHKIINDSTWESWDKKNNLIFNSTEIIKADYTVFALGGASWKITGSDGSWCQEFEKHGIEVLPFQASNCGYEIDWPTKFIQKHEGKPLKNISIRCDKKIQKGEAVITKFGLEGNAIYGLSPAIRKKFDTQKKVSVFVDLKPSLSEEEVYAKMEKSKHKNTTEILKNTLSLSPQKLGLIKSFTSKEVFMDKNKLAKNIKQLKLELKNIASLDEAISSVGGVSLNAVDENFQLIKKPNQYCIGEMLNWDAPTGGYLLQACFSMGAYLAEHLNAK